ncbi:hypothetical protein N657DRAFT_567815, partial [Parathielavia appendiculata]
FLPLREITINSRPLIRRAIQFSCDGEIAVAADDSVHVFVPEFPDLSKRRERIKARMSGLQYGIPANGSSAADDGSSDEDHDEEGGSKKYTHQAIRAQYSEGSKHMPVSFPPLDPRVNRELFTAQNIPFPYEGAAGAEGQDADSNDESAGSDDAYESEDEEGESTGLGAHRPFGAGYGPITGVGSSMNHVVCVGWSPSGLGVNRRPILGVLTGSGTLAMFGDGSEVGNILPRANEGMLQRRELTSWIVLWGLGERLVVPGQQTDVSEYLRGFAWAREIAPGQALLATVNDVDEVAVVSVQCVYTADDTKAKGNRSFGSEPREDVVWLVREVARFKAEGPHEPSNPLDPDYVPCGTSFGLKWGPWLQTGDTRTCVLSFIDRSYVGFRKVTIREPWIRGKLPKIEIGRKDAYGMCVHLSTDSFVEFEDAIWTHDSVRSCRGLIAAGGSEGSVSQSDDDEDDMDLDGDLDSLADEENVTGAGQATVLEIPEVHPHRFRLHGITLSPGGGVSAVLVSNHNTQHPERGGWHTVRSSVLFGHKPRRPRQAQQQDDQAAASDYGLPIDPQVMIMDNHTPTSEQTHLTTEAKLFENLYGGGPEVRGVHYPASSPDANTDDVDSNSGDAHTLRHLFAPALATQTCDLCGLAMDLRRGSLSGCRNGHFFGTCATSGLAVQTPGATRSCGACGLRTMRAEVLVAKMPKERREEVRRLVGEGLCGACGGKFLS